MNILFTAIGHSDPVANYADGPYTNILRFYDIDKVYLYASKDICDKKQADLNYAENNTGLDRYSYCLEKIKELPNKDFEYHIIEDENMDEPHKFDLIMDKFIKYLDKINEENPEADTIYLNISSGTTSMKSALVLLGNINAIGKYKLVQVSTPKGSKNSANTRDNLDKDFDTLWEVNRDNINPVDRTNENPTKDYRMVLEKENIHLLISKYDYFAPLEILENSPYKYSPEFKNLLKAARARYSLNDKTVKELNRRLQPENKLHLKSQASEYLILLNLKLEEKHQISAFLKGLTPMLTYLFNKVLFSFYPQAEKYQEDYYGLRWTKDVVNDPVFYAILNEANYYYQENGPNYVRNADLAEAIKYCGGASTDPHLVSYVEELREVERILRNPLAHQMVSFSNEEVKELTGLTVKDINSKLRYIAVRVDAIKMEDFKVYDEMNERLFAEL